MLTSFAIENFRTFDKLTIGPLGQVNLIAGKNNVGKTALLEALWLHHGANNLELPGRIHTFRGIYGDAPVAIFESLFRNFDVTRVIRLKGKGDWGKRERSLAITLEQPATPITPLMETRAGGQIGLPLAPATSELTALSQELVFNYKDENGNSFPSRGRLVERRLQPPIGGIGIVEVDLLAQPSKMPGRPLGRFMYAWVFGSPGNEIDVVNQYSTLVSQKREEEIGDTLKIIESHLEDLRIISPSGQPTLRADVGLPRRVPIGLMGGGMVRLLSIALGIATVPGGIILIDEIENGFHHTVLPKVWKVVGTFARKYDVQVFAATHSYENVRAACEAFKADESIDFRLHRLDRTDSTIKAVTYDLQTLGTALEAELEVR